MVTSLPSYGSSFQVSTVFFMYFFFDLKQKSYVLLVHLQKEGMGCLVGSHEGVSVKGDEIFIKHIQTNSNFVHISYTVITLYLITLHKWYFFKATLPPVLQNKFLTFLLTGIHPHSGVLLSQELKIHLLRTQSSKVLL